MRGATAMQELIEPMITGEPYPIKALIVYGVNLLNTLPMPERTLEALKKEHAFMEVVILTGHGSMDSAVECTRKGAYHYLQKPCELEKLLEVLSDAYRVRIMNKRKLRQEQMDKLLGDARGESPLAILRKLKELDE